MKLTEEGKIELTKQELLTYLDNLEQIQLSVNNTIETTNDIKGKFCLLSKELRSIVPYLSYAIFCFDATSVLFT